MLFFLLSCLTEKNAINMCSKPVSNLNHEYLHQKLIQCLNKSNDCDFNIIPVIMDCYSTNVKVVKIVLKITNSATTKIRLQYLNWNYKLVSFAMTLNDPCLKIFRMALFRGINYFCNYRLVLSSRFALEVGLCTVKWFKELHHKNKFELFSGYRILRNVAYVYHLNKHKITHLD